VQIGVNRQTGTFSISGGTAPITGKTGGEETGKCSGQCVPKIIKPKTFQPSTVEIEGQSFKIPEQQFDPNSDTISGSYTSPTEHGLTLIVTWSLQKCGAQANRIEPKNEQRETADFYALRNVFDETNLWDALLGKNQRLFREN
jgi:hypothetical protein